ncbi:MAG: DUF4342 domain-containing protein [Solobacterium sp.]|nr:DUF4342 domain-containing protein [Solobacterium sp.]
MITLEAVEKVMEETGLDYKEAKALLEKTNGNAEQAVRSLNAEEPEATRIVEKVKAMIKEGNVDRVKVTRKGEVILNLPVNVGIAGGLIGLAAAPGAMILAAIAGYGLDCKVEVVKKDGSTDEIR